MDKYDMRDGRGKNKYNMKEGRGMDKYDMRDGQSKNKCAVMDIHGMDKYDMSDGQGKNKYAMRDDRSHPGTNDGIHPSQLSTLQWHQYPAGGRWPPGCLVICCTIGTLCIARRY
jgi:hypothetical protein